MWLDEQPPHYFFNIIICWTCNMCPRAVEQATQATTRENLSSGFPTKWVLNQSLRLNRLARNWNFSRSKWDMIHLKTDDNDADETARMRRLVCAFIVTNHQRQVFAVAWTLRKHGKYDNSDIIVICAVSSKHLQCVCRHTKSYPAGDCFLYNTTWYTKVNMVFIELYKPRVTHMKYIEGK